MSKYFIDTEFLEGSQKEEFPISLFRKSTPNTIDLISIGVVSEDGREYYGISKDFNLKEAWNRYDEKLEIMSGDVRNRFPNGRKYKEYWIRDNVLRPIYYELIGKDINFHCYDEFFTYKAMKNLLSKHWKTNKEIAKEVRNFIATEKINSGGQILLGDFYPNDIPKPEFYAYYADYDWVAFCWLFGKMIDLPKGFPMYCKDLKQILDEKEADLKSEKGVTVKGSYAESVGAFEAFQFKSIKDIPSYPKQDPSKSHNALEDARWNKQLFDFLNTI